MNTRSSGGGRGACQRVERVRLDTDRPARDTVLKFVDLDITEAVQFVDLGWRQPVRDHQFAVALSLAIFSLADGILRCERLRQCQPLPRSPRAFHLAV
jgi:hypothetical protein